MIKLARFAMGTRFELVLHDEGKTARLQAAGEEALDEVERLERQLSLYRPDSELSGVNRRASQEWVRVEPRFFRFLQRALALAEATGGAFDPTVTPLLRAWGFIGARGQMANPAAVSEARERVGWQHLALDPSAFAVRFALDGMELDFGAIGKGYAVERALGLLEEIGVQEALLHGGASTIGVLGSPSDGGAWRVDVADPRQPGESAARIELLPGQALSVSAQHEKSFTGPDGAVYGHVLDPRLGYPVQGAALAAVVGPSATDTDALSTALLVLGAAPTNPPESSPWSGVNTLVLDSKSGGRGDAVLYQEN